MTETQARFAGLRIRDLREHLKLTIPELATKSGISKGSLSKIENGGNPTLDTLMKLAKVMRCKFYISHGNDWTDVRLVK